MKTYFARLGRTGWFVRVPRWLYNRWPWCGVVSFHAGETRSLIGFRSGRLPRCSALVR
jgi:hypothetical protein